MRSTKTSTDLYKSFLAKSTFTSGNIENAETVDGLDADMTGASSKGKSTSAPVTDDDRAEEDKKVKKKVDKNKDNGAPAQSLASTVGYKDSDSGKEDKLQDCGPYEFGGDVTGDIGVPPAGKLVDGYILRSEQLAEMMKGGEGSKGGKIIGHTKSGKPIYGGKAASHASYADFSSADHRDASDAHYAAMSQLPGEPSTNGTRILRGTAARQAQTHAKRAGDHSTESMMAAAHEYKAAKRAETQKSQTTEYQGGDAKSCQQRIERSEQLGELMKGGEGSRGGRIIGHTKSNKPVYALAHPRSYVGFSKEDHLDAMHLHNEGYNRAQKDNKLSPTSRKAKAAGHQQASADHETAAHRISKSNVEGQRIYAGFVAPNDKMYEQRIEQRGFVQHATGGMDDYLAHISKSNGFYANGSDHHNPLDANHVAQTLCKSCDQSHSALYGVCPHCGPSQAFGKSYDPSQNHAGFGMQGREQGSTLVDMSAFRLED